MSDTRPKGILLTQDEYDSLVEQVQAGEQARRERESLHRTLQVALGKLQALEISLEECEKLRDEMLNSA